MNPTPELRILAIDDDALQLKVLKKGFEHISSLRCVVDYATDPAKALEQFGRQQYDLVVVDYNMPGMSGLEVFQKVKLAAPTVPVVIITAGAEIEKVIEAMKSGVYDFLVKPVLADRLEPLLWRIQELNSLEREIHNLRQVVDRRFSVASIVGQSPAIQQVIETIGRCAEHSVNVLVRGESGTGKELVANAIHFASPRRQGPFVVVNIAALPEALLESELFGHAKGAFTGADRERMGRFEEANGGTLFIDEIGDVSLTVQSKLLRAIQFKQFQRIGENTQRASDVRIIAATSRDLETMMARGEFRTDLFYRLNVVGITIPPLRNRREDIPLIVEQFLAHKAQESGSNLRTISREAMHRLVTYHYPGNIRELQNALEHALVFCRTGQITTRDLPAAIGLADSGPRQAGPGSGTVAANEADSRYAAAMDQFERTLLQQALAEQGWNQSAAARTLGINERRLRYRMERLGISAPAAG